MSSFGKSSTHNFSLVEVLVLFLTLILVIFVAWPNLLKFMNNLKMSNAIDSVYSYKDSVNKYYVSRLMYDTSFKLDGRYDIVDGKLSNDVAIYNLYLSGNVPTGGYLEYDNNVLKYGCIVVDGYYVVLDSDVTSVSNENCMESFNEDVVDVVLGEI